MSASSVGVGVTLAVGAADVGIAVGCGVIFMVSFGLGAALAAGVGAGDALTVGAADVGIAVGCGVIFMVSFGLGAALAAGVGAGDALTVGAADVGIVVGCGVIFIVSFGLGTALTAGVGAGDALTVGVAPDAGFSLDVGVSKSSTVSFSNIGSSTILPGSRFSVPGRWSPQECSMSISSKSKTAKRLFMLTLHSKEGQANRCLPFLLCLIFRFSHGMGSSSPQ